MGDISAWLEFSRGPLFRASLAFMVLGLARHLAVSCWEMGLIIQRAGDRSAPWKQILKPQ